MPRLHLDAPSTTSFRFTLLAALLALAFGLAACHGDDSPDYLACLATSAGALEDGSYNQQAWNGMLRARDTLDDVAVAALDQTGGRTIEANLRELIGRGCRLIVSLGPDATAPTEASAQAHPEIVFGLVDGVATRANILTLQFSTEQAALLAGYAAASVSRSGIIATWGGEPFDDVTRFMDGYAAGVQAWNRAHGGSVRLLGWDPLTRTGSFSGDFTNTARARALTDAFIGQGADVILPVAGDAGHGTLEAALAMNGQVLVVWVDLDGYIVLDARYRSLLLTSVLKQSDEAIYQTVRQARSAAQAGQTGTDAGLQSYVGSLANGGVSIAPFHDLSTRVSASTVQELAALRAAIIAGTQVTTVR